MNDVFLEGKESKKSVWTWTQSDFLKKIGVTISCIIFFRVFKYFLKEYLFKQPSFDFSAQVFFAHISFIMFSTFVWYEPAEKKKTFLR